MSQKCCYEPIKGAPGPQLGAGSGLLGATNRFDDAWHGMARNDMAWHCMARNGMAWHAHHPWGDGGAACQLPPSESRGALLGVMVVEFASAIGIHTFCKLLYRSHRSPSAIVMP